MKRMSITATTTALTAIASLIAAMALAGGATAAACDMKQAFSRFGDTDEYTLYKNGTIEGGLKGFAFTGRPSVVPTNESYYLHSRFDNYALQLAENDSATFATTSLCKKELRPQARFVARALHGTGTLRVDVNYKDEKGTEHTETIATLSSDGYATWEPTPALTFLDAGLTVTQQTKSSLYLIVVPSGDATWQIDDVYIDPYRSR